MESQRQNIVISMNIENTIMEHEGCELYGKIMVQTVMDSDPNVPSLIGEESTNNIIYVPIHNDLPVLEKPT